MKISKKYLQKVIKEEVLAVLAEQMTLDDLSKGLNVPKQRATARKAAKARMDAKKATDDYTPYEEYKMGSDKLFAEDWANWPMDVKRKWCAENKRRPKVAKADEYDHQFFDHYQEYAEGPRCSELFPDIVKHDRE